MNKHLKKAIEKDELILFVGAGMSIPLGFPNWTNLIINILNKLKDDNEKSPFNFTYHIDQGEDVDVLDVLTRLENDEFKSKTKKVLYKEIEKIKLKKEKLIRQTKLWQISNKIITTNYDKAIDIVKPKKIKSFSNNNVFQQAQSIQGKPYLYKIHGDIDDPDTCILFPSDYEKLYGDKNPNKETLKNFLTNKTILFLGFSLDDPFVTKQLEYLSNLYRGYGKMHYIVQTKHKDFNKYNVKTIEIDNWNKAFDTFLDELINLKKTVLIEADTEENKTEDIDISKIDDLILLKKMYSEKKEEFNKAEDNKKKETTKDLYKLRDRILELEALKFDLDFKINIPKHEEKEAEHVFNEVFSSEKLKPQLILKINEIKNQHSKKYKWYHRSVIISGLACSLIYHKKLDPKKIDLLIDFTNDSEVKVWEKAVTYLFLSLNHLGNKWKRYTDLKPKLERLTEHKKIQEALKTIIALMQLKLQNVSFLDAKILTNDYFKDSPFNYFMPFYEGNPSINKLYDNENIENIENFINFIYKVPMPDATKYLICNENYKLKSKRKSKTKKISSSFIEALNIHADFEPYINHINTLVNFFKNSTSKSVVFKQKITVNDFKNILLNTIEHHRAFARQAMLDKNWGNAISHYEQILKLEENEIGALFNLANCYDRIKKDIDDRLQLRLRIEKLKPKNIDNLLELGFLYHIQKKYHIEIGYYDKCIKINKNNADAFLFRGDAKSDLKDYKNAVKDYNIAISLDNKNINAYVNRGVSKNYLKNYREAIDDFDKAISLDENNFEVYVNRGVSKSHLKKYREAIDDFDKAISLDENSIKAYIGKGISKREIKDYRSSIDSFDKVISLDPKNIDAYVSRGISKSDNKDFEDSIDDFDKAISLNPKNIDAYINRGISKSYNKDFKGSIEDFDKAISLAPKDIYAIANKANTLRKMNQTIEAHKLIDKAISFEKRRAKNYGTKAAIYASEGNDTKFYEFLEKAFLLKAEAEWLDEDIIEKYKYKEQFKNLLKKYDQTLK